MASLLDEQQMLEIALVRQTDTSVQGLDVHLLLALKRIIPLIGILHRGGAIMGRFIQPLEAFLGDLEAAMLSIVEQFRPGPYRSQPPAAPRCTPVARADGSVRVARHTCLCAVWLRYSFCRGQRRTGSPH